MTNVQKCFVFIVSVVTVNELLEQDVVFEGVGELAHFMQKK